MPFEELSFLLLVYLMYVFEAFFPSCIVCVSTLDYSTMHVFETRQWLQQTSLLSESQNQQSIISAVKRVLTGVKNLACHAPALKNGGLIRLRSPVSCSVSHALT